MTARGEECFLLSLHYPRDFRCFSTGYTLDKAASRSESECKASQADLQDCWMWLLIDSEFLSNPSKRGTQSAKTNQSPGRASSSFQVLRSIYLKEQVEHSMGFTAPSFRIEKTVTPPRYQQGWNPEPASLPACASHMDADWAFELVACVSLSPIPWPPIPVPLPTLILAFPKVLPRMLQSFLPLGNQDQNFIFVCMCM